MKDLRAHRDEGQGQGKGQGVGKGQGAEQGKGKGAGHGKGAVGDTGKGKGVAQEPEEVIIIQDEPGKYGDRMTLIGHVLRQEDERESYDEFLRRERRKITDNRTVGDIVEDSLKKRVEKMQKNNVRKAVGRADRMDKELKSINGLGLEPGNRGGEGVRTMFIPNQPPRMTFEEFTALRKKTEKNEALGPVQESDTGSSWSFIDTDETTNRKRAHEESQPFQNFWGGASPSSSSTSRDVS